MNIDPTYEDINNNQITIQYSIFVLIYNKEYFVSFCEFKKKKKKC